ncbi:hypothetical protein G3O08_06155 [Cryomorpha ignava]|uniref:Uncharacterized protein n=1 Tax=Cryomorpha ignava TaxID=101383 RepID=A0A7K3WN54_9FLAO|nr:hypothetical protein [Cryomorpha ignava]NEN23080.1 hypothetical protein [Cryomorpha ignava]
MKNKFYKAVLFSVAAVILIRVSSILFKDSINTKMYPGMTQRQIEEEHLRDKFNKLTPNDIQIRRDLKELIIDLKNKLPMKMEDGNIWDSCSFVSKTTISPFKLQYYYTASNVNEIENDWQLLNTTQYELYDSLYSTPEYAFFKNNEITLEFFYHTKNQELLTSFSVPDPMGRLKIKPLMKKRYNE